MLQQFVQTILAKYIFFTPWLVQYDPDLTDLT